MSLVYAEQLIHMPYNQYFTEYGNNSVVYKKTTSPFTKDPVYLALKRQVLICVDANPPLSGMFYLCDDKGQCLNIQICTDEGWDL